MNKVRKLFRRQLSEWVRQATGGAWRGGAHAGRAAAERHRQHDELLYALGPRHRARGVVLVDALLHVLRPLLAARRVAHRGRRRVDGLRGFRAADRFELRSIRSKDARMRPSLVQISESAEPASL